MKGYCLVFLTGSLLTLTTLVNGQGFLENAAKFFEFPLNENKVLEDSSVFLTKLVLAPIISFEPSTSLGMGIGAKLLFKPRGAGVNTRTSNFPVAVTYTLRQQFIFDAGYTIFFKDENYLLKGKLLFSKFPLQYFGVGSQTTEADKTDITFNNFLFEPLLLKKIGKGLFLGGGVRYNTIYNLELDDDVEGGSGGEILDELRSSSMGIELAITLDTRDNVLNALGGNFLEFTHGVYGKALGGTNEFMLSKFNFRKYLHLNPENLNVLALEFFSRIAWSDVPPMELSTLGGAELMRGFPEGRFRDRIAFFTQAEYRWQKFERIGFVFFAGAGEVSRSLEEFSFGDLKYGVGTGLRLKIVKSENLNIRFDYALGFGPENDRNFYLGISEAF